MVDENATSEETEHVRVGTRIIRQLSTTFYPKPEIIFDELVINARDAFAKTLKIHVGQDQITFEDDGQGMTREGLVRFFYISHSRKEEMRGLRSFKGVQRYLIGRFGIGKISLYQICRKFEISTWRDGTMSKAQFDFEEFEKKDFVDDFDLSVASAKTEKAGSGTLIILRDLKKSEIEHIGNRHTPTSRMIVRHLSRTMPAGGGFRILFSSHDMKEVEIKRESPALKPKATYRAKENVKGVGEVSLTMDVYEKEDKEQLGQYYGVFVRVYDRMVNADPLSIINFNSLSHPRSFVNKTRVEVNANGLDDVLLTNRSGFVTNSPKFITFSDWLESMVRHFSEDYYKSWKEEKEDIEKKDMPKAVAEGMIYFADAIPVGDSNPEKGHANKEETAKLKARITLLKAIADKQLKVEVAELGVPEPEATYDAAKKTLTINSSNPSYVFARSQGGLKALSYHIYKAVSVLMAVEVSSTVEEFKKLYDKYSRNVELQDYFKDLSRRKK